MRNDPVPLSSRYGPHRWIGFRRTGGPPCPPLDRIALIITRLDRQAGAQGAGSYVVTLKGDA